jgi:hypothetical protein
LKELVIHCTKCLLVLDEGELFKNLPPGVLEKALRKGKAYRRCERVSRYEKSREDYRKEDLFGKVGDLR